MTFDEKDSEQIENLFNDKDVQKMYIAFQLGVESTEECYSRGLLVGFLVTTTIYVMFTLIGVI